MKNVIFIILSTIIVSCNQNLESDISETEKTISKVQNKTIIKNFNKSFEGTINYKYDIIMTLVCDNNSLSGTYTYKSQGVPLKLQGTIDENNKVVINEFNSKGSMTGVFRGTLNTNETILKGNWSKPDGSKEMPFVVSLSSNNESSFQKKKNNSQWTGKYNFVSGEVHNILKIKGPSSDGAIYFEIEQSGPSCMGSGISGTAYLTKSNVANFEDDESQCHINFTFNSNTIQVKEYDCGDYHGARCGLFDGWYSLEH